MANVLQAVVAYASLAWVVWTLVDAARFPKAVYDDVQRMPRWVWLTGIGFGFAMQLWLGAFRFDDPLGPRSVMWMATMLFLAIYWADLRPRLRGVSADR